MKITVIDYDEGAAREYLPYSIVGVYGMNFKHMPEREGKWSYPVLWGFFIVQIIFSLYYFKRKKCF